jgi:hypothetical protein
VSISGVILFPIIVMLSKTRSYPKIHALIDARLALLNSAFPAAALRRAPACTSVQGILRQIDPWDLDRFSPAAECHARLHPITLPCLSIPCP